MALKKKKISARRQHVRDNMSAERFIWLTQWTNSKTPIALLILLTFVAAAIILLAIDTSQALKLAWKPFD